MFATALVLIGLAGTLWLPIYPQDLSLPILTWAAIVGLAGLVSLLHRAPRHELFVFLPWLLAIGIGAFVGSVHGHPQVGILRDLVPYPMFLVGLLAARGSARPAWLLGTVVLVAAAEVVASIVAMPSFEAGMRSSYNYFKITSGSPLVGLFALALLRRTDGLRAPALALGLRLALLVGLVMTLSRGMILAWFVGAASALAVERRARSWLVLAVVLLVSLLFEAEIVDAARRYLRLSQTGTIWSRLHEAAVVWDAFVAHPLLGDGLGATLEVYGLRQSYTHNLFTYHLWKFGLLGCSLLVVPGLALARELEDQPRAVLGVVAGGAVGLLAYLATSGAYKTYYVAWILGITVGSSLTWLRGRRS